MYLDNKYTKLYYKIIESARLKNYINSENHHIIPESFFIKRTRKGPIGWLDGNPEDPLNKVKLSSREHIICHILLTKMTTGAAKRKMVHALWMMTRGNKKFTSHQYEYARKQFKIIMQNSKKSRRSYFWTDEQKKAQSIRLKGKLKTSETKEKMKIAWTKRNKLVKDSTKEKLKETSTNYWSSVDKRTEQSNKRKDYLISNPKSLEEMVLRLKKQVKCIHCNIETNVGNHNRWHGDKCKLNTS